MRAESPATAAARPEVAAESAAGSPTGIGSVRRRHDLDALRGFAMLLGIALHASLAFFPGFWVVEDANADEDGFFDEFFHAVHGFRMPLFFLLSGYFTAMLWRRRGLDRLVGHRLRRIALPLAIGLLTIVPLTNIAIDRALDAGVDDYIAENEDIWAATFFGDERAVDQLLDRGVDVDAQNFAEGGDTPLHVAAFTGDAEMAGLLLGRGADPTISAADGRPIDYAVFFGNEEVADALVEAGVDDPRPPGGAWSDVPFWAEGAGAAEELEAKFGLESWLTSFHHLWFLWFLLWMIAGFAVVAVVADRLGWRDRSPGRWSGLLMWALVPLTLVPQLAMGDGGDVRVFGPDTSTGWVPVGHVLGYYAIFFAFGALLHGRPNRRGGALADSVGRWWVVLLPITAVVLVVSLDITFDRDASWSTVALWQVAYTWLAIISMIGVFHALLATERRGVRYLSDSAYWLYLAHLPLVIFAQTWIRNWEVSAPVKFVALTVGITIVLLISYQLFVRYTPIGALLNGRRTRQRHTATINTPHTGTSVTSTSPAPDAATREPDASGTTSRE